MRKTLTIFVLLTLVLFLFACTEAEENTEEMDRNIIEQEYRRILVFLPSSIDQDTQLPGASNPKFALSYWIDEEELSDLILPYEAGLNDIEKTLTIQIEYEDQRVDYEHKYINEAKDATPNPGNNETLFNSVFNYIESSIPIEIISDFTMPKPYQANIDVVYQVDHSFIERNRFVFPFYEHKETLNITAEVTLENETRVIIITRDILALKDLPKIPQLYINTENQEEITTKETYVSATLTLLHYETSYPNQSPLNDVPLRIRLRGNSTLVMPKKPYKLKFDEDTALLEGYGEKDWVLLANHTDQTLLRNHLAYDLATKLGMAFAPTTHFVDVFINDEYQGNYLLTEQTEVKTDRVNIEKDVSDIDTGYLIEWDKRLLDSNVDASLENHFIIEGVPFVIKSPDFEDDHYVDGQKTYIESYMQSVFDALKQQQNYTELIDEASFIDWFIVNEVFKNVDSGFSSVYFYKDKGELLHMGPVWDFDLSSGNYGHLEESLRGPTGFYTSLEYKNIIFYYLMQYESFRTNLQTRYNAVYNDILIPMLDTIHPLADHIAQSRYNNFMLYDIIGKEDEWYTSPELLALDNYNEHVWFLYDFLDTRIKWLYQELNQ
jgi:hypothetical protein